MTDKEIEAVEEEIAEPTNEIEEEQEESVDGAEEEQEEGVVVTIGDEEPEEEETAQAPEWVRELRKKHREAQKRIRELEAQAQSVEQPQTLGKKPTLEDFEYDTDQFEVALEQWTRQKSEYESHQAKIKEDKEKAERQWQQTLSNYEDRKREFSAKARDYEEAEEEAKEIFNDVQQGIILHIAEKPEELIYALGKNPKKARELAGITDHLKLVKEITKLEGSMSIKPKKKPPQPEKTVTGSASFSGGDSTLEKLREEAERTGDYTKVFQYKQNKKKAA